MIVKEYKLSSAFYTPAAVRQGARDVSHLCRVHIQPGNDEIRVRIVLPDAKPQLADEFLNYVLGLSAQELLA